MKSSKFESSEKETDRDSGRDKLRAKEAWSEKRRDLMQGDVMKSAWVESKAVIVEIHPGDYRHVESAAQKLGYAVPEFLLLSASLIAAVVHGEEVSQD
ncbi:hypothetical protein [Burkholderia metallica]|uniref:hypothetical protein n=1 Tax=Burkholderia metallica TaxID=488729 RepID=UPI00131BA644|nr:hypothetical protein [Burkholderia metallica]